MGCGSRIRDPGSGKNLSLIPDPDPGVKKSTGSRIRIRNTARQSELFACGPIHFMYNDFSVKLIMDTCMISRWSWSRSIWVPDPSRSSCGKPRRTTGKFLFSPGGAGVLRYLARKIPLQSWRRWFTQVFSLENSVRRNIEGAVLRYLTWKFSRTAVLTALHDIRYSSGKFHCSHRGAGVLLIIMEHE